MKAVTVYLVPHSMLRGSELPRSDTLFGAICWGIRLLFGENRLEHILKAFETDAVPFLLSSIFEYTEGENGKEHYFPKPLSDPYFPEKFALKPPTAQETKALKRLKNLSVVRHDLFMDMIAAEKSEADIYEAIVKGVEPVRPPRSNVIYTPHSAVNRVTEMAAADEIFYTEELAFPSRAEGQHGGMFFCMKWCDEFAADLQTVCYFLADKGIGGGVSSGKGQFTAIEIVEGLPYTEKEPADDESSHVITLSLTYPDQGLQRLLSKSWYTLERRQGKIESMYVAPASGHIWKNSLVMLQEGSTFPKNGRRYYGENPIVRRADTDVPFDVRQYGYAFTVNTKHIQMGSA